MSVKHYDEICNHCGTDIHPQRDWQDGEIGDVDSAPDCVYIQRFYASPMAQHGMTNYVCIACNWKIEQMLRVAVIERPDAGVCVCGQDTPAPGSRVLALCTLPKGHTGPCQA